MNVNIFIFNDKKIYYEELLIRYFKNVNIFILSKNNFYDDISKIIISNNILNTVGMYVWIISSEYYLSKFFRRGERLCVFNKLWFFDLETYDTQNQWNRKSQYKLIVDPPKYMGFKHIQPLYKYKQTCILYNKGNCHSNKCNRKHICIKCGRKHPFVYCIPHNEGCGSNTTGLMNLLSYINETY